MCRAGYEHITSRSHAYQLQPNSNATKLGDICFMLFGPRMAKPKQEKGVPCDMDAGVTLLSRLRH